MERLFTPADAARAVELPLTQLHGWLQRSVFTFATHAGHRRPRFDLRGLRILAVMRELTRHGQSPNLAAPQAASIVQQAGSHTSVLVSLDPAKAPAFGCGIHLSDTEDAVRISIPLGPLFAEIDRRLLNFGN